MKICPCPRIAGFHTGKIPLLQLFRHPMLEHSIFSPLRMSVRENRTIARFFCHKLYHLVQKMTTFCYSEDTATEIQNIPNHYIIIAIERIPHLKNTITNTPKFPPESALIYSYSATQICDADGTFFHLLITNTIFF